MLMKEPAFQLMKEAPRNSSALEGNARQYWIDCWS